MAFRGGSPSASRTLRSVGGRGARLPPQRHSGDARPHGTRRGAAGGSGEPRRAGCPPVSRACRVRAEASVSEAIWSTRTRSRAVSSGASREQGAEERVQPVGGARAQRAGQFGQHDALFGAQPLLVGPLHDVPVGDRLEHGALQPRLAGDDQLGRVAGERAGAVGGAGGALGGEAEPADELAGGVLQPGLGDGGAVVAVRPPLLCQQPVERGGQFVLRRAGRRVACGGQRGRSRGVRGRRAAGWGRGARRAGRPPRRAPSRRRRRTSP